MRVKKSHVRARSWNIGLIGMYEVVVMFFCCWRFIVLEKTPQCSSTKILHGYTNDKQTCLLQSLFEPTITICCYHCDFVIGIYKWFILFLRNSFIKIAISYFVYRNIRRNSLEFALGRSAKAPVCNKCSRSECEPTPECSFHSFWHWWTCFPRKLVHSSRHLFKN